jgi:ABC-2 type transport system permease protein
MAAYRSGVFFGLLRHVIIVSMAIILWSVIYKYNRIIDGYDFKSIVTYYLFVEIVDIFYTTTSARVLSRDINKGDLNNYLLKPINYWSYIQFYSFGLMSNYVLFGILAFILGGIFFPQVIFFPTSPTLLILTVITLIISSVLYNQIFYLVGCLTFWISETSHFRSGIKQLLGVMGGRWVPLVFFPPFLTQVLDSTPFPYLFSYVFKIYNGSLNYIDTVNILSREILWLAALSIFGYLMWRKGIVKYEAFGR